MDNPPDRSHIAGFKPWPEDAPAGQTWECPECGSRATLGGNAGFHRNKTGHSAPVLKPFKEPPSWFGPAMQKAEAADRARSIQSAGGKARAAALTPEQRRDIAQKAANARWHRPDGCKPAKKRSRPPMRQQPQHSSYVGSFWIDRGE